MPSGSSALPACSKQLERRVERHFVRRRLFGERCRAFALFDERRVAADAHVHRFAAFRRADENPADAAGVDLVDLVARVAA